MEKYIVGSENTAVLIIIGMDNYEHTINIPSTNYCAYNHFIYLQ